MINLIRAHSSSGEADRARAVVEKVARTRPSQAYLDILRADLLINEGDYAKAVALVRRPQRDRQFDDNRLGELGDVWLRLGNPEETGRVWDAPSWFASAVRGEMIPPLVLRGQAMRPRDFWVKPNYGVFAARAILQRGRADLLVKHYRDAFNNPREFVATLQNFDSLDSRALSLAMALMKQRERAEASVILTTVEGKWREVLARSPNDRVTQVYLARVRAIRGDRVEALNLLTRARGRRWLPDGIADPIDIAQDPAFETLVGNPAFEAVRRTILGYVARERREAAALPRYP